MTNRRLIFWILGASLLAGCSSAPTERPDCDIPAPMAEVGHPVSVPQMPVAVSREGENATFDNAGIVRLTQLRVAAETNKTVAEENALAIEARNVEVNELIECARYMGVWIDVHAEDLNDEKQDHFWDNVWHRGAILLMGVAWAL